MRGQSLLAGMDWAGKGLLDDSAALVTLLVPVRLQLGESIAAWQRIELQRIVKVRGGVVAESVRRLEDKTDEQVLDIGFALCNSPDPECAKYVAGALRGLQQVVPNPEERQGPYGLQHPQTCDPAVGHVRSPKGGFGFEYAAGWQASAKPVDGRVWSIGIEGRARVNNTLGVVARIDRSSGRDESIDADGDGHDDRSTGSVTRWTGLLGGSLRLATTRDHDLTRYWQLDSMVGLSRDGDRSGVIAAMDLSYELVVARLGVRVIQGLGGAGEEKAALLHAGFSFGAGPQFTYGAGCDFVERHERGSAWALAMDIPLSGWAQGVGYVTPGFGVEAAWHGSEAVDFVAHADLLAMPSGDRERALHQSLMAGGRIDLGTGHSMRKSVVAQVLVGYDQVATTSSAAIQSGPVVDASLAYALQASDGAIYWRLHGRFGLTDTNEELRAIFVSFGTEMRLDRGRWRDRD